MRARRPRRAVTPGEPLMRWDWVGSHLPEIAQRLLEHLQLAGIAVGVGFILSLLLSLVIVRFGRLHDPITWAAGLLYTIPSLALFAMLVPITGLSLLTAEIGL